MEWSRNLANVWEWRIFSYEVWLNRFEWFSSVVLRHSFIITNWGVFSYASFVHRAQSLLNLLDLFLWFKFSIYSAKRATYLPWLISANAVPHALTIHAPERHRFNGGKKGRSKERMKIFQKVMETCPECPRCTLRLSWFQFNLLWWTVIRAQDFAVINTRWDDLLFKLLDKILVDF